MKGRYKIKYSSLFYKDLKEIIFYIKFKLQNLNAAKSLIDEIDKAILNRSSNPLDFESYKSLVERKNIYYRIYVKNYTIFYVIKDDAMEVRRILYSRRNLRKII